MTDHRLPEDLRELARRVIWFESPSKAVADRVRFLAYLMTYGTAEDIAVARKYFGERISSTRSSGRRPGSSTSGPRPIGT
jgi:hypothetical protein